MVCFGPSPEVSPRHPGAAQACWSHRGCDVRLSARPGQPCRYQITHASGLSLGEASSLAEARHCIDAQLTLLRQRLAAGL